MRRWAAGLLLPMLAVGAMTAARAEMPDPAWTNINRLAVHCQIAADRSVGQELVDRDPLQADLCNRIRRIAAAGAPVPVEVVPIGQIVNTPPGTAGLLVHAAVVPAANAVAGAKGDVLAFTMRPYRNGPMTPAPTLFGAAPRIAPLPAAAGDGAALDTALRTALGEVLPWLNPGLPQLQRQRTKGE